MTLAHEPRLEHVQCLDALGLHRMAYWEWGDPANPRVGHPLAGGKGAAGVDQGCARKGQRLTGLTRRGSVSVPHHSASSRRAHSSIIERASSES